MMSPGVGLLSNILVGCYILRVSPSAPSLRAFFVTISLPLGEPHHFHIFSMHSLFLHVSARRSFPDYGLLII